MGKVVNLTEKLELDSNPLIRIQDKEFEVKADARTVLEVLGLFEGKKDVEASMGAYEKLFSKEDRKEMDQMHLSFSDLMTVIKEAVMLATGTSEEDLGEAKTRSMT